MRASTPATPREASLERIINETLQGAATVRDRRRLAGSSSGDDADRPADGLDGGPLLGVQAVEDPRSVHAATLVRGAVGFVSTSRQKRAGLVITLLPSDPFAILATEFS